MKLIRNARRCAVLLATLNWLLPISHVQALDGPSRAAATGQTVQPTRITDIALGAGGQLRGRVVDVQGRAKETSQIVVVQDGRQMAATQSDRLGRFSVDGIHGGVFQVLAGGNMYVCRGWTAGTAPPIATEQLLVVDGGVVERGQRPISDLFFADPIMVGLVVAAAIAIPIAISNSKKDRPPGS